MTLTKKRVAEILTVLDPCFKRANLDYLVTGGASKLLREQRVRTNDIDIFVAKPDKNSEHTLRKQLNPLFLKDRIQWRVITQNFLSFFYEKIGVDVMFPLKDTGTLGLERFDMVEVDDLEIKIRKLDDLERDTEEKRSHSRAES